MRNPRYLIHKTILLTGIIGSCLTVASAVCPPVAANQSNSSLAQGFKISNDNGEVTNGSLVSLKNGSDKVELATAATAEQLVGVVDRTPLIAIAGSSQTVQVVLSGTTSVLVSDINGAIKTGDRITASPIAGVGMLATSSTRIVGTAQSDLDTTKAKATSIKDKRGNIHDVHMGLVILQVGLSSYQAPGSNFLPPFLQNLANNIAGRQVSVIRVLICTVLLLMCFLGLGIFISSSARAAMISIGRNPLASKDVRKSLYQVAAITIAAWGGALAACYLILTL